jgi:hypothetical protein
MTMTAAIAARYVKTFGIATERGIARARTPALVESLIELHAAASREPAEHPESR